ncbi:hypothetical protein [Wolbachia endosymbiont of Ctenocephalides felis wCfeJ]|nr:hypothetical protein [Wolbachia endosymbiont of Ctenocephalides felis wCfeJ]
MKIRDFLCSSKGVIPARDAGIQPYFHFYAKSKIRGLYMFIHANR